MNEFTLEEINFLRWLLEQNQSILSNELEIGAVNVDIRVLLTNHQLNLMSSIQSKLIGMSSY